MGGIFRKSIIENDRFTTGLYVGEDTLFIATVLKKANRICSLQSRLYFYLIRQNSVYHREFTDHRYDEIVSWEKICDLYNNENGSLLAYALRLRMMWNTYHQSPKFDKFKKDLLNRYKKIKVNVALQYFKRGNWIRGIKAILFYYVGYMRTVIDLLDK